MIFLLLPALNIPRDTSSPLPLRFINASTPVLNAPSTPPRRPIKRALDAPSALSTCALKRALKCARRPGTPLHPRVAAAYLSQLNSEKVKALRASSWDVACRSLLPIAVRRPWLRHPRLG